MIKTNVFFDFTDFQRSQFIYFSTVNPKHVCRFTGKVKDPLCVVMIHVGCTRGLTSSTDNIMKIQAWITWNVECIRTCICLCFFDG